MLKSKPWFLKYYIPNFQGKETAWIQMVPQLVHNSETRQKKNADYQTYLSKLTGTEQEEEADEKGFNVEDYRLREALNIVKICQCCNPLQFKLTLAPERVNLVNEDRHLKPKNGS